MAERLKRQNNLTVLRVSLDHTNKEDTDLSEIRILFDFEYQGVTRRRFEVLSADLGLPQNINQVSRYSDSHFSIPPNLVEGIRQELSQRLSSDRDTPLWLEIAPPAGSLPVVPWERLIRRYLRIPLLRLPYYSLRPVPSKGRWNIVLCASAPQAKSPFDLDHLLNEFMELIPKSLKRFINLHIFTDFKAYSRLIHTPRYFKSCIVHNPNKASDYGVAERRQGILDTPGNLESPWLRWIIDSLEGESADVVHFLCHSYLSMGQGALAFAESPLLNRDREWARFVGPQQLSSFLTQIGAWSVGFSSPPNNFSPEGLRMLAEEIAHLRPGEIFLHDVALDPRSLSLSRMYRFLYSDKSRKSVPQKAISLYCHPSRVREFAQEFEDTDQSEILREFTLVKDQTFGIFDEGENVPAWIAASQRYLELSAAKLLEQKGEPESETQAATRRGIENSLRYLVNAIESRITPNQ